MAELLKPIINPKNKKPYTNVEIVKQMYKTLSALKNPSQNLSQKERDARILKFNQICGGSKNADEIFSWLEQINSASNDYEAQRLIEQTLLPIM